MTEFLGWKLVQLILQIFQYQEVGWMDDGLLDGWIVGWMGDVLVDG